MFAIYATKWIYFIFYISLEINFKLEIINFFRYSKEILIKKLKKIQFILKNITSASVSYNIIYNIIITTSEWRINR